MARQFTFTSTFKLVIAKLAALLIAVIGGLSAPAVAHGGNSGSSSSSGSGSNSGSGSSDSNSGPGPNSGPGNALPA